MECLRNLPTRNPASFTSSSSSEDYSLMQKVRHLWIVARMLCSRLPAYKAGLAQCRAGHNIMRSADRAAPIAHLNAAQ